MNKYFKSLLWPFVAFVIYLVMQGLISALAAIINVVDGSTDIGVLMGIALLASSIITSALLLYLKPIGLSNAFRSLGCNRQNAVVGMLAVLFGLVASNIINEFLDLPNPFGELFSSMSHSVWGMLAIGVAGPVCEEIVFRGGIMKPMLQRGISPWSAILTSAIVFGLVHGNPAQIPFAALVGILLGIVYYRTGSLVITSICHILNNSFSVILMNVLDEETQNTTLADMIGIVPTVAILVAALALCIWLVRKFWKQTTVPTAFQSVPTLSQEQESFGMQAS